MISRIVQIKYRGRLTSVRDLHNSSDHTKAKSNNFLLFVQKNLYFKTCLPPYVLRCSHLHLSTAIWRIRARLNIPWYLEFLSDSGYKGIFSLTVLVLSNSSCHPLAGMFHVLAMFLGRSSAISSLKAWNCFTIFYQNNWANATFSPGLSVAVPFSCVSLYNVNQISQTSSKFGQHWLVLKN